MKDFKAFESLEKGLIEGVWGVEILDFKGFFVNVEVWVKDFKDFDLRFRFLVKN